MPEMSPSKLIAGIISNIAIFGVLLFVPAGTLNWWRAWIFLSVLAIATVASTISIYRVNKAVLEERFKSPLQKGQPLVDKIIVTLFLTEFAGLIVFIPLDVFRFQFTRPPGPFVSLLGLVLFIAGWWIITLTLQENAFAAPAVRHLADKHQTVIDTGVYSLVRHPMYAGVVPLLIGMSLWLQSFTTALLAIAPITTLAVRIYFEEDFLRRELKGYEEYTRRVHYRLLPFVW